MQTICVLVGAAIIDTPKTPSHKPDDQTRFRSSTGTEGTQEKWVERKLAAGPIWQDYDLVFCTAEGKPIYPSNVLRSFARLIEMSGVRRIRFHDLRHTNATWLVAQGNPLPGVSSRLGHARASTTLNLYAHAVPTMQDQSVDTLQALFAVEMHA